MFACNTWPPLRSVDLPADVLTGSRIVSRACWCICTVTKKQHHWNVIGRWSYTERAVVVRCISFCLYRPVTLFFPSSLTNSTDVYSVSIWVISVGSSLSSSQRKIHAYAVIMLSFCVRCFEWMRRKECIECLMGVTTNAITMSRISRNNTLVPSSVPAPRDRCIVHVRQWRRATALYFDVINPVSGGIVKSITVQETARRGRQDRRSPSFCMALTTNQTARCCENMTALVFHTELPEFAPNCLKVNQTNSCSKTRDFH